MLRPVLASLTAAAIVGAGVAAPAAATLPKPVYDATPTVLINELTNGDANSDSDGFFELRNWGDEAVDLTGWEVFRCTFKGLRSTVGRTEGDLAGVVLQPGEIRTVSRIGLAGDDHISATFDLRGFGLYLEAPDDTPVDLVGVYPNDPWPMQSECTPTQPSAAAHGEGSSGNLPNILDFAQNESWQRVAATGDPARDWIVAPSTIAAPNATTSPARADSEVVISELAGDGPDGPDDDFVELRNDGDEAEDIGGWQLLPLLGNRPGAPRHPAGDRPGRYASRTRRHLGGGCRRLHRRRGCPLRDARSPTASSASWCAPPMTPSSTGSR